LPNDEAPPTEVTEATSSAVPQRGRSSAPLVLYAAVTLSILIAWVLYARLLGTNVLPIDDPYIAMRNAHLLANGEPDTRFPGATPVHGSTSLVHTVLVAGLMKALSPLAAMDVARWLGVLAYALGLARLGLAHTRNVWVAAAGVVAGLLVGQTPHQVLNGLETGLAMAAVAWWLVWASHERPTGCLAVLCGIMPYIRPELAALSTAGLLVLWQQHVGAASPRRVAMMGFGRSVLLALLAAAPWALVYWHYTGAPYTPTAAAKMYYFAEGTHPLAERIIVALLCTGSFLQWHILPLAFAPVFYYVHRAAKLSVAFVAVLVAVYAWCFPGALAHFGHRYLYVAVPVLVGCLVMGIGHGSGLVRKVCLALVGVTLVYSLAFVVPQWRVHLWSLGFTAVELEGISRYCQQVVPEGATILVHDAGYMAWRTEFPLNDLVGLKTPGNVAVHKALTWPSAGKQRSQAIDEIALRSGARYCVVRSASERLFGVIRALSEAGWGIRPLGPRGLDYQLFEITPPTQGASAPPATSGVTPDGDAADAP